LKKFAGLKVWYDPTSGDASKRTTALLSEGLQSARGAIFVLSSSWTTSTWCQDEHELALSERRAQDGYSIRAIRLDETAIPPWFKVANVIDFRQFDQRSAADLLRSMTIDPAGRYDNDQDVYFAGPWTNPGSAVKPTLRCLQEVGWRLVGDSPDHPAFKESLPRIRFIMESVRGLVAFLPFSSKYQGTNTSPFILAEVRIAQQLAKPYMLLAEEGVNIPDDCAAGKFGEVLRISPEGLPSSVGSALRSFDSYLEDVPHSDARSYSFLAASLREDDRDAEDVSTVVERASNMRCVRGVRLSGQHVQAAIIDRIRNAGFVIADISNNPRNSLIEAGVALGAGVSLRVMCRGPLDGSAKAPFMFGDGEVNWYENTVQQLATVYRIGRLFRRRIIRA